MVRVRPVLLSILYNVSFRGIDPSSHVHYGAFLRSIPVTRRLGDYAHAAARILYAVYKRLMKTCDSRCCSDLRAILAALEPSAKHLLPTELTSTPASVKAGIDLTAAHIFLSSVDHVQKVVTVLQTHGVNAEVQYGPDRKLLFHVVIKFLLLALCGIYKTWRRKDFLSAADITAYQAHVDSFRMCWVSLNWKPTVWVHWMCAHSYYYIEKYANLFVYSSLPTERRHQGFKLDLRHAFQGWKIASPLIASRFLRSVVEQDALDLALHSLPSAKKVKNGHFICACVCHRRMRG